MKLLSTVDDFSTVLSHVRLKFKLPREPRLRLSQTTYKDTQTQTRTRTQTHINLDSDSDRARNLTRLQDARPTLEV